MKKIVVLFLLFMTSFKFYAMDEELDSLAKSFGELSESLEDKTPVYRRLKNSFAATRATLLQLKQIHKPLVEKNYLTEFFQGAKASTITPETLSISAKRSCDLMELLDVDDSQVLFDSEQRLNKRSKK